MKTTPQAIYFLVLFSALLLLVGKLFAPFLFIIMWAALFYLILNPFYRKVVNLTAQIKPHNKIWQTLQKTLWAALFAIFSLIIVFVPLIFLMIELMQQFIQLFNELWLYIVSNPHFSSFESLKLYISEYVPFDLSQINLRTLSLEALSSLRNNFLGFTTGLVSAFSHFIIGFLFMMFSLFFFLTEGPVLLSTLIRAIPIDHSYSHQFINRFKEAGTGILMGFFLTALIQGFIAFILFSLFGVKASLAWASLVSVTSFIPMIGAGSIWIPLSIMMASQHGFAFGLFFAVVCGVFISFSDNFIRPFLLSGGVNIHPLFIFFSILGGLQLFGINGLILGPLVVALFFTATDIFLQSSKKIKIN